MLVHCTQFSFFPPTKSMTMQNFVIDLWHLFLFLSQVDWPLTSVFACPSGWLTLWHLFLFLSQVDWPLTSVFACPSGWLTLWHLFLFIPQIDWPLTSVFACPSGWLTLWHLFLFIPQVDWPLTSVFCLSLRLIDLWYLFLFAPQVEWPSISVLVCPSGLLTLTSFLVYPSGWLTCDICFLFVPQVDNPVSIMNQETSKNFLLKQSAKDKYKVWLAIYSSNYSIPFWYSTLSKYEE